LLTIDARETGKKTLVVTRKLPNDNKKSSDSKSFSPSLSFFYVRAEAAFVAQGDYWAPFSCFIATVTLP
jgi:hypothetical protein